MPKTRGKGESSIYKRASDGLWCTAIELPRGAGGKRRRKVVARKSKADVIKEMNRLRADLKKLGDLNTANLTVEQWGAEWLRIVAGQLAPNTVSGYRSAMKNFIIPILGKKKLERVTPPDVRNLAELIQALPKSPKIRELPESMWPDDVERLSSTYALLVHNTLSGCLKMAVHEGKIADNPCDRVKRPAKRATDEQALTPAAAKQLLAFLANHPDGAFWATFLLTGARRGEVCGLEIERVTDVMTLSWQMQNLTAAKTEILPADWEHRHIGGTLYLARPKVKSKWRTPPLVEPLKSILERAVGNRVNGFVFLRENGKPWEPDDATTEWKNILEAAGLPTDVKLHGIRHTTADLLYDLGIPEHIIQEILGHSVRATTRGYRTRGDIEGQREALVDLGELLAPKSLEAPADISA